MGIKRIQFLLVAIDENDILILIAKHFGKVSTYLSGSRYDNFHRKENLGILNGKLGYGSLYTVAIIPAIMP